MKIGYPSLITLLLLGAPGVVWAQDEPAPSPPDSQVERFHVLIGQFEGSGTFVPQPGLDPVEWTAVATGSLVLDGHVVQLDETIQTPMGPLEFRTLYGWDDATRRLVSYTVGTTGIGSARVGWDGDALVSVTHGSEEGQPYAERSYFTFTDEGYSFRMDRFEGVATGYEKVRGTMKKVSKLPAPAAAGEPSPDAEMLKLTPLIGSWAMAGTVNSMGTEMNITASEVAEWLYGGLVIGARIAGQPGDYKAAWYIARDPELKGYRYVYATSTGQIGMKSGRLEGDQLVLTESLRQFGQPSVTRSVVQFEEGAVSHVWEHTITGVAEPMLSFTARYLPSSD